MVELTTKYGTSYFAFRDVLDNLSSYFREVVWQGGVIQLVFSKVFYNFSSSADNFSPYFRELLTTCLHISGRSLATCPCKCRFLKTCLLISGLDQFDNFSSYLTSRDVLDNLSSYFKEVFDNLPLYFRKLFYDLLFQGGVLKLFFVFQDQAQQTACCVRQVQQLPAGMEIYEL